MARKLSEEYARRSALRLGVLSDDGNRAIARWDTAVQRWKKEKGAGARPLLAEGVLLDCLSRFHGIGTTVARIRAANDPQSRRELETLGTGSFGVISYLAAISRAETARGLEDADGARRWYARAAERMPSTIRVGPLELDTRARRAMRRGDALVPTAREYTPPLDRRGW